MRDQNLYYPCS